MNYSLWAVRKYSTLMNLPRSFSQLNFLDASRFTRYEFPLAPLGKLLARDQKIMIFVVYFFSDSIVVYFSDTIDQAFCERKFRANFGVLGNANILCKNQRLLMKLKLAISREKLGISGRPLFARFFLPTYRIEKIYT